MLNLFQHCDQVVQDEIDEVRERALSEFEQTQL